MAARLGTLHPARGLQPRGSARGFYPEVALLTEIRADFSISWADIETFERGAPALETAPAEAAARDLAKTEDHIVLYGGDGNGSGFLTSAKSPRLALGDWSQPGRAVADLIGAVDTLDRLGIAGPYVAVVDPQRFNEFWQAQASGCGYPASEQVRERIQAVYRSAVIGGGAVFSTRGGDFVITVGGDLNAGYRWHDVDALHLFCVETVAARLLTSEAVCLLSPA